MDKERYDDYKLLAMNYGKLEEWITVEKLCEMIERSTEQTFGLLCTFFICNDILKTQPY